MRETFARILVKRPTKACGGQEIDAVKMGQAMALRLAEACGAWRVWNRYSATGASSHRSTRASRASSTRRAASRRPGPSAAS